MEDEKSETQRTPRSDPETPSAGLGRLSRAGKSRRLIRRKTDRDSLEDGVDDAGTSELSETNDNGPCVDVFNKNENSHFETEVSSENNDKSPDGDTDMDKDLEGRLTDYLPPWAATIANVMKPVVGYMAGKALGFMKVTLQYVPDVQYSDEEEEAEFEDAEQDSESEFEDAAPQLGEKDRIQHICEELLTTEEDYVRRLHILVKVKSRTTEILKPEIANMMFKDIETIYQFHYNTLLPQLQERLKYWEKYRKIGDIMKRFAPFLKLYTEYVKNFENSNNLVNQWAEKSNKFASFLKEVQVSPEHGRLKVQAHMLEPVQRVPRYQLLLRDYLKRLPEDHPDVSDTKEALEGVVKAASHFEDMMKRDSRMGELMSLQNRIEGATNIVSASRSLVKEGKITTLSVKTGKEVDRHAFLFNDLLLICNEMGLPGLSTRYKVKHSIELGEAALSDAQQQDSQNTFYIQTTEKIIEVGFSNPEEKTTWFELILKHSNQSTKEKVLHRGSVRAKAPKEQVETLGKQAPLLVHLSKANKCMLCEAEFSPIRRKKHCRACGNVVCGKCSNHTAPLEYDKAKPLKVCDECFVILQDTDGGTVAQNVYNKCKTEGVCLEKGFLHLSIDGGKSTKRRWFSVHDSGKLYSFKSAQDVVPISAVLLSSYAITLAENQSKKGPQIIAVGEGKTYQLHGDDPELVRRWFSIFETFREKPSSAVTDEPFDDVDRELPEELIPSDVKSEDCESKYHGTVKNTSTNET